MKLTLKKLLAVSPFSEGTIINKTDINLNNYFDSVTVMDNPDINQWIKPHEILIIGDFFKDDSIINSSFIEKINSLKCPAVITKKKYVEYMSPSLLLTIDKLRFPIIALSDNYSWSEVTLPIYSMLLESSQKKNNIYENFDKILRDKILKTTEFNNICSDLAEILNVGAALVNKNNTIIDSSEGTKWADIMRVNNIDVDLLKGNASYRIDNSTLYAVDLENNYVCYLFLLVPDDDNEDGIEKYETLIQILKLKIKIYVEFFEEKSKENQMLLEQLLNYDKLDISTILSIEMTLKHIIQNKYYIAIFDIDMSSYYAKAPINGDYTLTKFLNNKFNTKNEVIIFENKNTITVFISNENPEEYISRMLIYLKDYFATSEVYCGISSYNDIKVARNSYNQAKSALNFTKNNKNKEHFSYYTSIGFLRLLTDSNGQFDNIYYHELIDEYITPIILYDKRCSSELLPTLITFIETCYSYKKSSELLFIHVNTLRARLDKIEELLNIDRHNSDDMLNLQLALKIYLETQNK